MNCFFIRGLGFSLLLHGVVLCSILYVRIILPDLTPPLVIDFSVENDSSNSPSPNSSHKLVKPTQEKGSIRTPVKKNPPIKKTQLVEKKIEPIKTEQLKQPDLKPQKKQAQRPVPKKIVLLHTKKRIAVEEQVRVAVVAPISEPVPVQIPQETVESTTVSTEEEPSESQDIFVSIPVTVPATPPKSLSIKDQYLKANFSFIRDIVARKTSYPDIARRMGWEGKVFVAFTVSTDGQVEDIRIIKGCGYLVLDKNAINTIKLCAPFPKPPLRAEVTLPITYRLN